MGMGRQIAAGNEEEDEKEEEVEVGGYVESGIKEEMNGDGFACM